MSAARRLATTLLALSFILVIAFSSVVHSAELLMIEDTGCVYCERFNREIAPAYAKTDEGRSAPLRRIQLNDAWPDDLQAVKPARFTPTFILVDQGREIDRLAGYPGDEYFWFLLGQMLDKL